MEFKWHDFKLDSYGDIEPYINDLLNRKVDSDISFRKWLTDRNNFTRWFYEAFSLIAIKRHRYSTPENFERFQTVYNATMPQFQVTENDLNKLELQYANKYNPRIKGYERQKQVLQNHTNIYRKENVDIQKQITEHANSYAKLQGALSIEFNGKQIPYATAMDYLRQPDREIRKTVYYKMADGEAPVANAIDEHLTAIIEHRKQAAANAGFGNNVLQYLSCCIDRFDYDIATAKQLHQSVRKLFVPLFGRLNELRKNNFGYDTLYPWDLLADLTRLPPARYSTTEEMVEKFISVLDKIHPGFSGYLIDMYNAGRLDLESRMNKRGGAYCNGLTYSGVPFVFANFSKESFQPRTFFHEFGHALHEYFQRENIFAPVCRPPMEVNELASQALELISSRFYPETFYNGMADEGYNKVEVLKYIIFSVVFTTMQDEFCHWLYETPNQTAKMREAKWEELYTAYNPHVEFSSLEKKRWGYRPTQHYFFEHRPMYHIEYTISMLGAAKVYFNAQQNMDAAIDKYIKALRLGNTVSIGEIYEAAGIEFNFGEEALAELAAKLDTEISALATRAAATA